MIVPSCSGINTSIRSKPKVKKKINKRKLAQKTVSTSIHRSLHRSTTLNRSAFTYKILSANRQLAKNVSLWKHKFHEIEQTYLQSLAERNAVIEECFQLRREVEPLKRKINMYEFHLDDLIKQRYEEQNVRIKQKLNEVTVKLLESGRIVGEAINEATSSSSRNSSLESNASIRMSDTMLSERRSSCKSTGGELLVSTVPCEEVPLEDVAESFSAKRCGDLSAILEVTECETTVFTTVYDDVCDADITSDKESSESIPDEFLTPGLHQCVNAENRSSTQNLENQEIESEDDGNNDCSELFPIAEETEDEDLSTSCSRRMTFVVTNSKQTDIWPTPTSRSSSRPKIRHSNERPFQLQDPLLERIRDPSTEEFELNVDGEFLGSGTDGGLAMADDVENEVEHVANDVERVANCINNEQRIDIADRTSLNVVEMEITECLHSRLFECKFDERNRSVGMSPDDPDIPSVDKSIVEVQPTDLEPEKEAIGSVDGSTSAIECESSQNKTKNANLDDEFGLSIAPIASEVIEEFDVTYVPEPSLPSKYVNTKRRKRPNGKGKSLRFSLLPDEVINDAEWNRVVVEKESTEIEVSDEVAIEIPNENDEPQKKSQRSRTFGRRTKQAKKKKKKARESLSSRVETHEILSPLTCDADEKLVLDDVHENDPLVQKEQDEERNEEKTRKSSKKTRECLSSTVDSHETLNCNAGEEMVWDQENDPQLLDRRERNEEHNSKKTHEVESCLDVDLCTPTTTVLKSVKEKLNKLSNDGCDAAAIPSKRSRSRISVATACSSRNSMALKDRTNTNVTKQRPSNDLASNFSSADNSARESLSSARTSRRKAPVSYAEPKLNKKMRRGDAYF